MPQIVEPETGQARLLGYSSPSRAPAFQVPRWVKASDAVIDYSLAAEGELRDESGKDEVRRFHGAEAFRPPAKLSDRQLTRQGET